MLPRRKMTPQKKGLLQEKQLHDTEKRDKFRIYGELLHVYGYSAPEGADPAAPAAKPAP